ncbi:MAG TPA: hypothetical protein VI790_01430 [Candidatus Nanoarchaeia archaeon]|nr:hypothetical protein [Candidatus Nanoarchaeia archaeon]
MILLSSAKTVYGELMAECLIKPETKDLDMSIKKVLYCDNCSNCCEHVGTNFTERNYEPDNKACKYLTNNKCAKHDEKRPITCTLYPFNVYAEKRENDYLIQIIMTNCTGKPKIIEPAGNLDKLKESLADLILFGINPMSKTLFNALKDKQK